MDHAQRLVAGGRRNHACANTAAILGRRRPTLDDIRAAGPSKYAA